MTDTEMYELLLAKSQNIKMHMDAADVAGIAERFKALSEKQIPKKVTRNRIYTSIRFCPECGMPFDVEQNYCEGCGQRLLWEDEE